MTITFRSSLLAFYFSSSKRTHFYFFVPVKNDQCFDQMSIKSSKYIIYYFSILNGIVLIITDICQHNLDFEKNNYIEIMSIKFYNFIIHLFNVFTGRPVIIVATTSTLRYLLMQLPLANLAMINVHVCIINEIDINLIYTHPLSCYARIRKKL